MDWTSGLPGSLECSNRVAASLAVCGSAPTTHLRNTSETRAAWPARLDTGWAQIPGMPWRLVTSGEPVYRRQFEALLSSPGWTTGLPLELVSVAPPMMLLIARAATWRLSTGLNGLYGWCRLSDQETWPPCRGVIGSRPSRPVPVSLK